MTVHRYRDDHCYQDYHNCHCCYKSTVINVTIISTSILNVDAIAVIIVTAASSAYANIILLLCFTIAVSITMTTQLPVVLP